MTDETSRDTERKEAANEGAGAENQPAPGQKEPQRPPLPPLDFITFILSLSTSVLMNLGLVENPVTKKTEKELPVARQTIDLLSLLKEKTRGNLTEEEAGLLDNVLHELQMQYVRVVE